MFTAPLLQALRTASLRRCVLAWVLMAWAGAWAAPLLQPAGLHVVCGANGHVKLVATAPAVQAGAMDAHDCPLCTPPSLMPASVPTLHDSIAAADSAAVVHTPSPPSATTGALPPARGPPLH